MNAQELILDGNPDDARRKNGGSRLKSPKSLICSDFRTSIGRTRPDGRGDYFRGR